MHPFSIPQRTVSPSLSQNPLMALRPSGTSLERAGGVVQARKGAFMPACRVASQALIPKQVVSVSRKLTRDLCDTFQGIQRNYARQNKEAAIVPIGGLFIGATIYSPDETPYKIMKKLGDGGNATVYKVNLVKARALERGACDEEKQGQEEGVKNFAIKVSGERDWAQHWQREEERFIQHCNDGNNQSVIKMFQGFSIGTRRYTVFEELSQDLSFSIYKDRCPDEKQLGLVKRYGKQLAEALVYLGSKNIIHGDLKPQNILFVDNNTAHIRLVDFGLSQWINSIQKTWAIQTIWYRSPEVALKCWFDETVDVWSFGCILAELYIRTPLFEVLPDPDIAVENKALLLKIAEILGDTAVGFIKYAYSGNDPSFLLELKKYEGTENQLARIVFKGKDESQATPDEKLFLDLLEQIFQIAPYFRISAAEIVKHPFFAHHDVEAI